MQLQIKDEGSIFLLAGGDDEGREWLAYHLEGAGGMMWGPDTYVVEHRYVDAIVEGFENDGGSVNIRL